MKRSGDWSPLLKSNRQFWRPKTSNLETDDIDNDQDGHPIQQSMATKMAIMNRHQPAIMIDSSSSILSSNDSPNMMIIYKIITILVVKFKFLYVKKHSTMSENRFENSFEFGQQMSYYGIQNQNSPLDILLKIFLELNLTVISH
ncbi:hypothetical protein DERF_007545 [Dermatophagoides farinae]|uniref:Uncharacterized protein n=1 Tax=Dermatophagoides farinae TaxID=6954 RepID=A0A922I1B3_DERFA|nr:hypothetical protein DERF_007545 [Dermatophagoides farinae]